MPDLILTEQGNGNGRSTAVLMQSVMQETCNVPVQVETHPQLAIQSHQSLAAATRSAADFLWTQTNAHPIVAAVLPGRSVEIITKYLAGKKTTLRRDDYLVIEMPDEPSRSNPPRLSLHKIPS